MTELEILLIEDDDLQRKALCDVLTRKGHGVQSSNCLAAADEMIGKQEFDLVLLDMHLPDGKGLDFLSRHRKSDSDCVFVLITAFANLEDAVNAIKLGAYDYLSKPYEDEHIDKIVRNVAENVALAKRVQSLSRMTSTLNQEVWQFDNMIGTDALKDIFEKAQRVASFSDNTSLLILGESGTGKGMLAKAIHRLSNRADKPFVDINCSAIPAQLIESEIFGYEKGAFTDAKNRKSGLLEVADGGTVFLDEIGDMDVNLQSKLLKVIEDKEFRRLGSPRTTKVDVRIIAATNRDLQKAVKDGTFREDLYYRLSVVPIELPPLREHKSSISPLSEHYLRVLGKEMNRSFKGFTAAAMDAMMNYSWPGNVRELRNAIERSIILAAGDQIDAQWLGLPDGKSRVSEPVTDHDTVTTNITNEIEPMSLAECEKRLITSVLKAAEGNKNKAAEILNIHRTTLYKKIEEYGIKV